ncbi:hypothetical protein [Micromonospora cremea]|uniref:hypothetical protein n=1 Tax=Micromonospora cremea TaxID=709881 RepID=UPI001AD80154
MVRYTCWVAAFAVPPALLITRLMVPTPPSETVTMLVNRTFGLVGALMARSAMTAGFTLKQQ